MDTTLATCRQLSRDYLISYFQGNTNYGFQRYYLERNLLTEERFSILLGSRGIGKTVSLLQLILAKLEQNIEGTTALYVPIDHVKLKGLSLYEIGTSFAEYGGTLLCIDEIHKYEHWAQDLKSIVELFKDLTIIVSGSSILEIQKESHDLSRRALVLSAFGMSFREYLSLKYFDLITPVLTPYLIETILENHTLLAQKVVRYFDSKNINILEEFSLYLQEGYYPYFNEMKKKENYWQTLEQQIHAIVEQDIPHVYSSFTGATSKKIIKLLHIISESVPYIPNYKRLKEALGVADERTLKQYLKILEDALLIQTVNKHNQGLKQIEEIGKFYLQNPNLQWALSNNPNIGTLRETFLLSMLKAQNYPVRIPEKGDFEVQIGKEKVVLEVGGKGKNRSQIFERKGVIVSDGLKVGFDKKIPLWLFGFLY